MFGVIVLFYNESLILEVIWFFYLDRVGVFKRNFIICGLNLVIYLLLDFWGDVEREIWNYSEWNIVWLIWKFIVDK